MSAAATSALPSAPGSTRERITLPRRAAKRLFEPGKRTLDDRIGELWQVLVEDGAASCVVCGAEAPAGRPCASCGSELS